MGLRADIQLTQHGLDVENAYGRIEEIVLSRRPNPHPLFTREMPDCNGSHLVVAWYPEKNKTDMRPLQSDKVALSMEQSNDLFRDISTEDITKKAYRYAKQNSTKIRSARDDQ